MNLEQIIDLFKNDPQIGNNITHWETIPPRDARFVDYPDFLDKRLTGTFKQRGIEQLFSHPASGFQNQKYPSLYLHNLQDFV